MNLSVLILHQTLMEESIDRKTQATGNIMNKEICFAQDSCQEFI